MLKLCNCNTIFEKICNQLFLIKKLLGYMLQLYKKNIRDYKCNKAMDFFKSNIGVSL